MTSELGHSECSDDNQTSYVHPETIFSTLLYDSLIVKLGIRMVPAMMAPLASRNARFVTRAARSLISFIRKTYGLVLASVATLARNVLIRFQTSNLFYLLMI